MTNALGPSIILNQQRTIKAQLDEIERLRKLAYNDQLTGLPNRTALESDYVSHNADAVLMLIDLDGFKKVNDTQGHAMGDHVLCHAADFFGTIDNTAAYRLGGDEFVLIVRNTPHIIHEVAMRLDNYSYKGVTLSFGMKLTRRISLAEALSDADARMYESKKAKGARREDRRSRPNR